MLLCYFIIWINISSALEVYAISLLIANNVDIKDGFFGKRLYARVR